MNFLAPELDRFESRGDQHFYLCRDRFRQSEIVGSRHDVSRGARTLVPDHSADHGTVGRPVRGTGAIIETAIYPAQLASGFQALQGLIYSRPGSPGRRSRPGRTSWGLLSTRLRTKDRSSVSRATSCISEI